MPQILYKHCDQIISGATSDETTSPIVFNNIVVDGVTYTATVPISITNQIGINNFFINNAIKNIYFSFLSTGVGIGDYTFVVSSSVHDFVSVLLTLNYGTLDTPSIVPFSPKYHCYWGVLTDNDIPFDGVLSIPVSGCTDSAATNFNPLATYNDGSCAYSPAGDLETIQCCIGDDIASYGAKVRDGKIKDECCCMKTIKFHQRGFEYLNAFIPAGTVIKEGVEAHPAYPATAVIDLSELYASGDGAFYDTVIEIDGATIIDDVAFALGFYDTFDDYITALLAAIAAYPFPAPVTVVYDPILHTITFTSNATGTSYNGTSINFSVTKDQFVKEIDYASIYSDDPALNPVGNVHDRNPASGICYDPSYPLPEGQCLVNSFGGQNPGIYNETTETGALPIKSPTNWIVYVPITGNFIISTEAGALSLYGTGPTYPFIDFIPGGITGWGGVYNEFIDNTATLRRYVYWVSKLGDKVLVVNANDMTAALLPTTVTQFIDVAAVKVLAGAFRIAVHPVTNNIWIPGDLGVVEIDVTGLYGLVNTVYNRTNLGTVTPRGICFVDNAGTWEIWICGTTGGGSGIDIYNDDLTTLITSIDTTTNSTNPHFLMQHSTTGYVFMSSTQGPKKITIIEPVTRTISFGGSTDLTTNQGWPNYIAEKPFNNKLFVAQSDVVSVPSRGGIAVYALHRYAAILNGAFSGGANAVDEDIPAIIVEDGDGTNCLTETEYYDIVQWELDQCGCDC